MIYKGERLDSLQFQGLKIIQKEKGFCFGTDSVLLADFASVRSGDRVVDLGTGTGILSILMASRQEKSTYLALEIQPDMADMARRSVALNGFQGRIAVLTCDFRTIPSQIGYGGFTLAVCNPPYGKAGGTLPSLNEEQRIARYEDTCTVEDMAHSATALLRTGGRLAVIYPASRALELMCALRNEHLEPKRVRTVHSRVDREPKLILLEAVKGGGSMLHWLPPLILSEADGSPTAEFKRIYRVE